MVTCSVAALCWKALVAFVIKAQMEILSRVLNTDAEFKSCLLLDL